MEKESLLLILAQRGSRRKEKKRQHRQLFPDVERLQLEKKKLEVDLLHAQIWKAEKEKRLYN